MSHRLLLIRAALATPFAFASIACENTPAPEAGAMRDSAGIMIVENESALWNDASAWHVSSEPTVTIGVLDGKPEYQLFRASGAFALSDGRIVVANNGTSELRYYSPTGEYLFSAGGRGGGPGEFQSMEWGRRTNGDSVVVYERDGTISLFDKQGGFVDAVRLELNAKVSPTYVARLTRGTYLVLRDPEISPEAFAKAYTERPMGTMRETIDAVAYDADGSIRTTLGSFPGSSFDTQLRRAPGKGVQGPVRLPVWFAPNIGAVAFADSFYIGTGDTYEVVLHDAEGKIRRIVRRDHDPDEITQATITEKIEQARTANTEGPKAAYFDAQVTWLSETPAAAHFPAYGSRLHVDADHNLWVEQFTPERWNDDRIPDLGLAYDVFDAGGQFLGLVELPPNFEPTDIGANYVLGLWEGEFEVQYALKFALEKPNGGTATDDR